jgi:hypothetical protein
MATEYKLLPRQREKKRLAAAEHRKTSPGGYEKKTVFKNSEEVRIKARAKVIEWRKNNPLTPEKRIEYNAAARRSKLKAYYGLTVEEYEKMKAKSKGRCAICKIISDKILHIDHDHKTRMVRGLLCQKCNMVLGLANDSEKVLQKAIDYLRKHNGN